MHETFGRWARARPTAAALVEGDRVVTYDHLDRMSDAWAADLAEEGAGRGDVVPILLPRSIDLVTALLAVLKTGAAYCLLPPDWPARRLRDVLTQLSPPLLIARADRDVPVPPPTRVWSPPAKTPAASPGFRPAQVDSADPACVFFTSGTTGRPKGVLSPHRATARLFRPGTFARFDTGTVMPLAAATPWDAFSLELWSVLLNGGTSVIVTDAYLSAAALSAAVSRHGADTVWLTSSLFNMIVDEAPDSFRGLSQVAVGGERLSAGHVRRFLRRHPEIVLLNGYGPVESTVFATTHRITEADCDHPSGIPLGRPVPGTEVHILDGTRPCAVGETGEICLAGDGLALEYIADPVLTAAKFEQVRLDGRPVRVYRTGDLGHWSEDGLLRFDGRADRQLKIRGHRVEPAEVERQIERLLAGVRQCRVLPRGDAADGSLELVAFCVPVRPGDPLDDALGVLHASLVAHQRPAAVVSVEAFPVTARGKLDERALLALAPPSPAWPGPVDGTRPQDIHDPVLRAVAEAFADVLGREAVPLDTPFIRLGGTSLGAGRLCARLAALLARPVPVSWLYEHPTAAALAARLTEPARPETPAVCPDPVDVPLTPMQVVYLTRQLRDPDDLTGHCLLTWVIEGELDVHALDEAVTAVHERHGALRAEYLLDPSPVVRPGDVPAPPLEVLPEADGVADAVATLRSHFAEPLFPDVGEVWRTALVPVRATEAAHSTAVFGCAVHHVAFDGWSEQVLAADLAAAYRAGPRPGRLCTPAAAIGPRPSLTAVHRLRLQRRRQVELTSQRDYLAEELVDVPPLCWPVAPTVPEPGAPGRFERHLPGSVVERVDTVAAETGVTRFVVLLQLWAAGLAEVTGQRDFALGVPVAQRDAAELEHAIGCHINMLCLRMRGAALGSGAAALAHAGRIASRAFAAQDVPFPEVLSCLGPPRDNRPPLYQTLFACQDNATPRLVLAGARTAFVRQPYLDLPLELHAELWPADEGGLCLDVSYRPDTVAESTARDLAKLFLERVHTLAAGAPS
ncbi:amino acid adenylation domain-containing protein [Streptomyces sp. NPDC046759]|uniref:amino acid adenylation domain-containing protein n=1 Tax=Streptomyces sp. NPDC046759 TaxID=3155019 RepID=UPI0033F32A7B